MKFGQSFEIPDTFASLNLYIQWDRGDFLSEQGIPFAALNTKTHRRLSSVRVPERLTWLGVMPKDELQKRIEAAAEIFPSSFPFFFSSSSTTNYSSLLDKCNIRILVIGPSTIGSALAREFDRLNLQLHHPDPKPKDLKYRNPQWLYWAGPPLLDEPGEGRSENFNEDDVGDSQAVLDGSSRQILRNKANVNSCS